MGEFDRRLSLYVNLQRINVERDRKLERNRKRKMTPAEIAKLTEQATRGKALMARSSKAAVRSATVFDNFEATLTRFEAGVEQVDQQEKALSSQLMAMGNAGPILDATFSDDAVKAAPVVNGTGGAAPSPLAQSNRLA